MIENTKADMLIVLQGTEKEVKFTILKDRLSEKISVEEEGFRNDRFLEDDSDEHPIDQVKLDDYENDQEESVIEDEK
jgi:hypothetical protein